MKMKTNGFLLEAVSKIGFWFNFEAPAKKLGQKTFLRWLLIICMSAGLFGNRPHSFAAEIDAGDSAVLRRILDNKVIRVGINPLFKPFSFPVTENGQTKQVGVDIDIAELLAKELEVAFELIPPPQKEYAELIKMLRKDEIDIIIAAMSRIFQRAQRVDFSDSYYDTGTSIMLNLVRCHELGICEAKDYFELKRMLKAKGNQKRLIIAATSGKAPLFSIKKFFDNISDANIRKFDTNEQAAEATAETTPGSKDKSKPHIMVHDEIFLNTWVRENPDKTFLKVRVFQKPYRKDSYGFAIKKGNQSFLNMLNIFISDKLYGERQFDDFMNKYTKDLGK